MRPQNPNTVQVTNRVFEVDMFCFSVQLHSARAMRGASGNAVLWGGAEPYQGKLYCITL